jgi:hypothetical protein
MAKFLQYSQLLREWYWGARYLTGENLEVVWVEFSSLGSAVLLLLHIKCIARIQPLLELKTWPRFCPGGCTIKNFTDVIYGFL